MQRGRKKATIVEADSDLLGGTTTGQSQKGQSRFQLRAGKSALGVIVFGLALCALFLFHHTTEINVEDHHEHHLYETTQQLRAELQTVAQELNQTHKALVEGSSEEKATGAGHEHLERREVIREERAESAQSRTPKASRPRSKFPRKLSIPRKFAGGGSSDPLGDQIAEQGKPSPVYPPAFNEAISKSARGGRIKNDEINEERRQAVKGAMKHSWRGYRAYAWGSDELLPISKQGSNDFGHLGATVIDSIDTLWIMGLDKEYGEAREFLTTFQDSMMGSKYLSWFECIIRLLGGFMSTYYLTGDPLYLENAKELGDRLLPAFHNDTAGIPNGFIGLGNGQSYNGKWLSGKYLIAEIGTNQLEFYALSRETGDMKYAEASAKPLIEIHKKYPDKGLLPAYFSQSGTIVKPELYSTGAMVDSYLEYLIKVWVQAGEHKEQMIHDTGRRWEKAMDEMLKYLVKRNKAATYLSDVNGPLEGGLINSYLEMNHLSCFAPGMLALGAYKGEKIYSSAKRKEYLATAEELMRTCYGMYHETKTGLGGEIYAFFADKMAVKDRANRLRPEAVESLMILHRVTGKDQYREWGWEMFQAFEDHCKIESGYSGLIDVTHEVPDLDNKQQTWFLAETLKYFYLLFSPEDVISLDQWVFNTEAHPMMIWS